MQQALTLRACCVSVALSLSGGFNSGRLRLVFNKGLLTVARRNMTV